MNEGRLLFCFIIVPVMYAMIGMSWQEDLVWTIVFGAFYSVFCIITDIFKRDKYAKAYDTTTDPTIH